MEKFGRHHEKVETIAKDVRRFFRNQQPFYVYHKTTNCTRKTNFNLQNTVDTSCLNDIVDVDRSGRTIMAESNVSMEDLARAAYAAGMLPKVVMELPSITVGGGFSGTSGESSSFKHGLFEQTVDWIEMILADGSVITASSEENSDLFFGCASTFGSLGIVTLLRVQLIEAKPFVCLSIWPVCEITDVIRKIEAETKSTRNDYVDAILFSRSSGAVMTGRLVDTLPHGTKSLGFSRARDPWFYQEVERRARTTTLDEIFVHILDYLFRYNRGTFWGGHYALKYLMLPDISATRFVMNSFLQAKNLYHIMHEGRIAEQYIIQDLAMPWSNAEAFVSHVEQSLGLYPLWLCPLVNLYEDRDTMVSNAYAQMGADSRMLLNVGVWGPGPLDPSQFRECNRRLERRVKELQGQKALYARAYYNEDEFWAIYDHEKYQLLRSKYKAESLPTIFEKIVGGQHTVAQETPSNSPSHRARMYNYLWCTRPLPALYGLWKTLRRSDYLVKRSE